MDIHKSVIAVHSEGIPGQGSVFSIFLGVCRVLNEEFSVGEGDATVTVKTGSLKGPSQAGGVTGFISKVIKGKQSASVIPAIPEVEKVPSSLHFNSSLNSDVVDISSEPPSNHGGDASGVGVTRVAVCSASEQPVVVSRLLIVDDSPLNRKLLGRFLKGYFDEILYAEDGAVALDLFTSSAMSGCPINLVLMDNVMPNLDGLQAAQGIRSLGGVTGAVSLVSQVTDYQTKYWSSWPVEPTRCFKSL